MQVLFFYSGVIFREFLKKAFYSNKASFSELKRGRVDNITAKVEEIPFQMVEQF